MRASTRRLNGRNARALGPETISACNYAWQDSEIMIVDPR